MPPSTIFELMSPKNAVTLSTDVSHGIPLRRRQLCIISWFELSPSASPEGVAVLQSLYKIQYKPQ